MALLEIRTYDDPVLREKAQPIGKITADHKQLADDMAETMYHAHGIGLAANQIGILERIIIVDIDYARAKEGSGAVRKPVAMINPEIIEESVEDDLSTEGCLSLPGIEGDVWRATGIRLRYQNLSGKTIEQKCEGLFARCVQHEVDHLNGVLFFDRMGVLKRKMLAGALRKLAAERKKHQEKAPRTEGRA